MDIVTLGELLIDMFPSAIGRRIGEVEAFIPKPGGAPANVAVAARRLGATSGFIGKVGDDPFGHFLKTVLENERVDTRGMRFDPEARTTMAVIGMPNAHSAEFVFYRNPGADQRLRPDELDVSLLRETKAFHFGSLSLTDEPARSATIEAIETVRDTNALISYDVNYRPSLWKDSEQALGMALSMLMRVDLLKVNETEAELLTGIRDIRSGEHQYLQEPAEELVSAGPKVVLITLGENGSFYQTQAGGGFMPPFKVDSVDAVGCGDAFSAGLLVGLLSGDGWQANLDLERLKGIVRYANAVGALTSLVQGVIPALPTAAQVEEFLSKHDQE